MDHAYDDANEGDDSDVGGDSGDQDAYPSASSSVGRSPIPHGDIGGFEGRSAGSSGPVFMPNAGDVQAPKSDTERSGNGDSKRYPVASVEFDRVKTPFIIGVWIFCASLAKIGEYRGALMCRGFP
jgi:sodium/hydrogen exchanger-like protein 3